MEHDGVTWDDIECLEEEAGKEDEEEAIATLFLPELLSVPIFPAPTLRQFSKAYKRMHPTKGSNPAIVW